MSNALRRKKKPMQPLGYTKEENEALCAHNKLQMQRRCMTNNVTHTLRNLTFFLLYDKFGFGKTKLGNFQKGLETYKEDYREGKINVMEILGQLAQKSGINLHEHAVNIPTKEKCSLAGAEDIRQKEDIYLIANTVRGAYQAYMAAVLTTLKNRFRFTKKKMQDFINLIDDHINSFYRGYFADGDLIEVLAEEIGYRLEKGE